MRRIRIIFLLLLVSIIIKAQSPGSSAITDPISSGLGNSFVTPSNGLYSLGKNPANIILDDHSVEFLTVLPVPNVSLFGGSNFISMKEYNYYFGGVDNEDGSTSGRYLTEYDRSNLKDMFEDGGVVASDISLMLFGVVVNVSPTIGTIGFSINDNASTYFDFPEGIIELALDGNEIGRVYDFSGADFRGWWLRHYNLTYANRYKNPFDIGVDEVKFGVSVKYIQGFAYFETDHIKTTFLTSEGAEIKADGDVLGYAAFSDDFGVEYDFDTTGVNKKSSFSPFPDPAGIGFGGDIGFDIKFDEAFRLSIAVTDIGSIKWTKNVAKYSSTNALVFTDITEEETRDSILKSVTGDGEYIDSRISSLSTAIRVGTAIKLDQTNFGSGIPGRMELFIEYNQGINNQPGNSTIPRISVATEWWPIDLIPIRTGFSFGGRFGLAWGAGTGINAGSFEFNISAANFASWLKANDSRKFTVSFGSRFKI